MLTKIAGFVLAGSLVTLAVGGVAGAREYDHHRARRHRIERRIEARIENSIENRIDQHMQRGEHVRARDYSGAQGTYALDASGDVLGKFPWSAHVELSLRENGRYELRVKTNMDGETETETSWGRYRFLGDRVRLYSGDDDTHDLMLNGERLELNAGFKEKLALKAVGLGDAAFIKLKSE